MYQILMNSDKSLITTEKINLYQREKLVDKIQFIIPKEYNGYDLTTFVPYIKYTNPLNEVFSELLEISNADYKENYFTCILPVDTKLTKYAGDIHIRLQLTKFDEDQGQQVALTTDEDVIQIKTVADIYNYVPDEPLDAVTKLIGEIDSKAKALDEISQTYAENQVDDLEIDSDTDILYVTASGVRKGSGVEILTEGDDGSVDGKEDGIIDVNDAFIDI